MNRNRTHVCTRLAVTVMTVLFASGCPGSWRDLEVRSLEHDGLARTYLLHVPASYTGDEAVPLVLALHGGRGTGRKMSRLTGFNALSEREGFIVVYPEGVDNRWNDGREARQGKSAKDVDDVGFIAAMLDALVEEFAIDDGRVYATGASNGAMMSHRLACELTDRFAAIAPVIGAMPEKLEPDCTPSGPISVLMINGEDDRFVPWDGGAVAGRDDLGRLLSVEDTVKFWVGHNACPPEPEPSWLPDARPHDGTRVWREDYGEGPAGGAVVLYGIEGGGHTWAGGPAYQMQGLFGTVSRDIDASAVVWTFLAAHPKD